MKDEGKIQILKTALVDQNWKLIVNLADDEAELLAWAARDLALAEDNRAVPTLITVLQNTPGKIIYGYAAEALGWFNDERVIEPLNDALKNEYGRRYVALALLNLTGKIPSKKLTEALLNALRYDDHKTQIYALDGLLNVGVKHIELLIDALNDEKALFRGYVMDLLAEIRDTRAVQPLIAKLLNDPDFLARQAAATALGEIGDATAVEPLISVLSYEDEWLRASISIALGNIGDTRGIAPLKNLLRDEETFLQKSIREALRKLGHDPDAQQ